MVALQIEKYPVRPWLIGESNPYGADPRYALYPEPAGCAGWRLCHKVFGLTLKQYIAGFNRRNLLEGGHWSVREARAAAGTIERRAGSDPLILLGSKVAKAFGWEFRPYTVHLRGRITILPHPSGLSRAWNDPSATSRSRTAVESALHQWYATHSGAESERP